MDYFLRYTTRPCGEQGGRILGENDRHLTETNFRYYGLSLLRIRTPFSVSTSHCYSSNSRYNGHQSASFDILAELSQITSRLHVLVVIILRELPDIVLYQ